MRISQIHQQTPFAVSFELFPPKTPETMAKLFDEELPALAALNPSFMTCTYGAGGSTRGATLDIVTRIAGDHGLPTASHLTCVGASKAEIGEFLDEAKSKGIQNIVALRGDPPKGDTTFKPHPDGFHYANELIAYISDRGDFDIAVAGYPEGHPESESKERDWQRCAEKVKAGGQIVITQLFYDNRDFFAFSDYLKNKLGVAVPIVPGRSSDSVRCEAQNYRSR